jgi:K+-transporting ATPase ATPase B chain
VFSKLVDVVASGRGPKARPPDSGSGPTETLASGDVKPVSEIACGDVLVITAGELIHADGIVVEGIAMVDESAMTGESAPVLRESDSVHCAVIGGTRVLSGRIVVEVTGLKRP